MFACVGFSAGGVRMRLAMDSKGSDSLLLCRNVFL